MKDDVAISLTKIEEGDLQRYMADDAAVSDEEWLKYVVRRYEEIKEDYRSLVLQRREAEAQGREDLLAKLAQVFRWNYKARVWSVRVIRGKGYIVEDSYVPEKKA